MEQKYVSGKNQFAIFIFVLILFLGAYVYIIASYYKSINSHVRSITESTLTGTSKEIDFWLDNKRKIIETISESLRFFEKDEISDLQSLLKLIIDEDGDFIDVFFATAESPREGGFAVYATDWAIPDDYDWTERSWFLQAKENEHISITPPYTDLQTGRSIISISNPIYIDSHFFGVISTDISTDIIEEIIKRDFASDDSYLNLLDAKGYYINHRDIENISEEDKYDLDSMPLSVDEILSGRYSIIFHPLRNRFEAYAGLGILQWILIVDGSLSSVEDVRLTAFLFSVILLFLGALFIGIMRNAWNSNGRLSLASEEIERANRDLEITVTERTESLRNILDNAEEGFFTFGENITVDANYSRGCLSIFDGDITNMSVPELLFPGMQETIENFHQGFELYFNDQTRADIIFDLTENQTRIKGRIINLKYKETAGKKILCIMNDVTLSLETEEKEKRERENHQRILKAIHNKHFFAVFLDLADHLFELLEIYADSDPSENEKIELMRGIHTFKGDAGFFSFIETQHQAHECETLIDDSMHLQSSISYRDILLQIRKAFYRELKSITEIMGENWLTETTSIAVPRNDYKKLIQYVGKIMPGRSRLQLYLESFEKIPISELFSRLPFVASVAAEKLGKRIKPMIISGGSQKIIPDRLMPLADTCVHMVNNIVDHGIEYPYEREALQKPPEGSLELAISVEKSELTLTFRDDGKGINPKLIEKIARERGIIGEDQSLTESKLLSLIFEDGFTTKKEATILSGRGVGLSAVKQEMEKLGGTIEVQSRINKGTTIELSIPLGIKKKSKES